MSKQRVLNDLQRTKLSCRLAAPSPPSSVSKLSLFLNLSLCCPVQLTHGKGGGGGRGAESYDYKKAWASINHSFFSGPKDRREKDASKCRPLHNSFSLKSRHIQPVMMEKVLEHSKTLGTPLLEDCSSVGMEADRWEQTQVAFHWTERFQPI